MEKHQCKLCLRNFANGRALGGHMRSHMMNLYVPPKPKQHQQEEEKQEKNDRQVSEEMESLPSPSSSSSSEEEEDDEEIRNRGLMPKGFREKPKKRRCLVDPEFSFAVEATGSVVLQDRESETESSKKSICRRSKRIRKSRISETLGFSGYSMKEEPQVEKPQCEKEGKEGKSPTESPLLEHEPVSSISDTTPEEDVAYCLMMLSRDKWNEEEDEYDEEEKEEEEESEQEKESKKNTKDHSHDSGPIKATKNRTRGKYRCETCKKTFRSYQALGGHRASHKRIKVNTNSSAEESAMVEIGNAGASCSVVEGKIHECPVCYRVFSSGQALGGHKRSHVIGAANISIPAKPFSRFRETLIDLNLPAPMDDDDISQIELSAVSDAEFLNAISQ